MLSCRCLRGVGGVGLLGCIGLVTSLSSHRCTSYNRAETIKTAKLPWMAKSPHLRARVPSKGGGWGLWFPRDLGERPQASASQQHDKQMTGDHVKANVSQRCSLISCTVIPRQIWVFTGHWLSCLLLLLLFYLWGEGHPLHLLHVEIGGQPARISSLLPSSTWVPHGPNSGCRV